MGNSILSKPSIFNRPEFESPTLHCAFFGKNIVVVSQVAPRGRIDQNKAFADEVRLLVEGGKTAQAVKLLRQKLSIPLAGAKKVVSMFEAGNYGDEAQIIADVLSCKGS